VYDAAFKRLVDIPDNYTTTAELQQWLREQHEGDIIYEFEDKSIVAGPGVKIAVLDVNNWIDADQISTEQLRNIIHEKSISRFSVSEFKTLEDRFFVNKNKPVVPIIAIKTRTDNIVLIRPDRISDRHLSVKIRHRSEDWRDLWFASFITGQLKKPVKISKTINIVKSVTNDLNYTATVPNGVTVKLIGVCEHPSKDKQWWQPDGSVLVESPYHKFEATVYFDNNEQAMEIAVRLFGPNHFIDQANVEWKIPGSSISSGNHDNYDENDRQNMHIRAVAFKCDAKRQSLDFKMGIAVGLWQTVSVCQIDTWVHEVDSDVGRIFWQKPSEKDGMAFIAAAIENPNHDIRINAIAKQQGGRHVRYRSSSSYRDNRRSTQEKFYLPLAMVKEFQLQTRPCHWIEFKNISLQPGPKTITKNQTSNSKNLPDPGFEEMIDEAERKATSKLEAKLSRQERGTYQERWYRETYQLTKERLKNTDKPQTVHGKIGFHQLSEIKNENAAIHARTRGKGWVSSSMIVDGVYSLGQLEPATYDIILGETSKTPAIWVHDVEIKKDQASLPINLELGTASVSVMIYDDLGNPLKSDDVELLIGGTATDVIHTYKNAKGLKDGLWEVDYLYEGQYYARAVMNGKIVGNLFDLRDGRNEIKLTFEKAIAQTSEIPSGFPSSDHVHDDHEH
jgi:hypothetical protein